jgi:hypothetical protein
MTPCESVSLDIWFDLPGVQLARPLFLAGKEGHGPLVAAEHL